MIRFVYPPECEAYRLALDAIVDPILPYLADAGKFPRAGDGLNVALFLEPGRCEGCQVFLPHGIADKGYRRAAAVARFAHVLVSGPAWAGHR